MNKNLNSEEFKQNNMNFKKELLIEKKELRNGIHSLHRYFGKLIPAIPRFAIKNFTQPKDIVLDCFMGSGTTLVEAKYLDRNSYGIDINPLAVLIAKAKINSIRKEVLEKHKEELFEEIENDSGENTESNLPFCINMNHWFKPFVQKDLVIIKRNIEKIDTQKVRDFFNACFSACIRNVSNADTQHIFPGYSKRLRAIDSNGGRNIQVLKSFERGLDKRIRYHNDFNNQARKVFSKAYLGNAKTIPQKIKKVNLIVTNPPYISSIRYLETMKLEMFWLQYILSSEEYRDLDQTIIGTERFFNGDVVNYKKINRESVDRITKKLFNNGHKKMSRVVSRYFEDMNRNFSEMYRVLDNEGHIVMKISDSFVRGKSIPTSKILIEIGKENGFELISAFKDKIESRSLLTKRNSYSGIISHDWILIFKK